jgi:hypothetical protein
MTMNRFAYFGLAGAVIYKYPQLQYTIGKTTFLTGLCMTGLGLLDNYLQQKFIDYNSISDSIFLAGDLSLKNIITKFDTYYYI